MGVVFKEISHQQLCFTQEQSGGELYSCWKHIAIRNCIRQRVGRYRDDEL